MLRCYYCNGPITGKPEWRNGRAYHAPLGRAQGLHVGGCADSDRRLVPAPHRVKVGPDQLTLGV